MTAFARAVAAVRGGEPAERHARELLAQLTGPELLGLLDGDAPFWRGTLRYAREGYGRTPQLGGAVPRLGIPGLRFTDGPRGVTLGESTCFPVAMARGATWDVELEREIGRAMGREARAQGANCIGAPCLNLLRHPAWGRAQETYGEDPVHVGALGAAFTRGVQEHVMACAKHLALNSIENARFEVDVEVDDDALHEVYLPHFKDAIDAGARVVMSAYNAVNGTPCGDSRALLTDLLRDDWRFTGFVISDWIWGLRDPVGSVRAGLDIEMPFRMQRARVLPGALARGELAPIEVERAAVRILATLLAHEAGLAVVEPGEVAGPAHRALARRAAGRAITLLRNQPVGGAPVLPLDPARLRRLAVVGRLAGAPNLGDPGSSNVHPPAIVTILDGLRAALPGVAISTDEASVAAADAVVAVVGYRPVDEGEYMLATDPASLGLLPWPLSSALVGRGIRWLTHRYQTRGTLHGGDRAALTLRAADEALLRRVAAANPHTIALVIAGSAVVMEAWRTAVPAIALAWYPGMEGGHAVADVLLGRVEPGGRLPFAIPTSPAHLPPFDSRARAIRYDRWHGYRKLARDGAPPAFAFGFGLGYTTFVLADLELDPGAATASASVTNTGPRAGSAVVQLYASVEGEPRQLIGFARTELAAGASTRVTIAYRAASLRRRTAGRWRAPRGAIRFELARWAGDPDAVVVERELG